MKKLLLSISICSFLLTSCKKEPVFSEVPEIEFVSVNPTNIVQFRDSVVFEIRYKDGNGDLGENSPTAENLFLKDSRASITYKYRIPAIVPNNNTAAIQGNFRFVLKNTMLTDTTVNSQTVSYSIQVRDRAGNYSNTVSTPQLIIRR